MKIINIGILASHNGSGFDALYQACQNNSLNAKISVVISNNTNATVLQKAKNNFIANFLINDTTCPHKDISQNILKILKEHECDYIFLSGYMKKIDPLIIEFYEKKIFNAHPSLLPKFGGAGMYGRSVHEAVIASNEKISGVTIHEVSQNYDEGKIVLQKQLTVNKDDTAESLENKIKALEKRAIVEAFSKVCSQ
ncbi:MAG: phosphoribosylglycinamide formyltransferase [Campylobacterota bacterium]|nr:phosphoribosylglycinamide formyltransferase [Campylobacterota bacterium]